MTEVVSIKFKNRGKCYYFSPNGLQVQTGVKVIVETSKGLEIADCVRGNHSVMDTAVVQPLRPVLRIATEADERTAAENLVIEAIADAEHIRVTEKDLADYKRTYREQYARMLLDDPKTNDEELKLAIMTKKVLSFLMENNTWRKGE